MKLLTAALILLLVIITSIVMLVMHFIRRGVKHVKDSINPDLNDEETFRRMSQKNYRPRREQKFDKDYFKSAEKKSESPENKKAQPEEPRRTTTAEGVTIIDDRQTAAPKRKIFEDNEGEYVEFTEE